MAGHNMNGCMGEPPGITVQKAFISHPTYQEHPHKLFTVHGGCPHAYMLIMPLHGINDSWWLHYDHFDDNGPPWTTVVRIWMTERMRERWIPSNLFNTFFCPATQQKHKSQWLGAYCYWLWPVIIKLNYVEALWFPFIHWYIHMNTPVLAKLPARR